MTKDRAKRLLAIERERLEGILEGFRTETGEAGISAGDASMADLHPADAGSDTFERAKDYSILSRVEAEVREVEAAFRRLSDGRYGVCEACGRPIPTARLEVMPATRFCVNDQAAAERRVRIA